MVRTRKAGFAHCFWQHLKLDVFWETERKGKEEGVRKRERGTKREKREKEGKEKRKLIERETEHIF